MDLADKSTIYDDAFTYDQIHSPIASGKDLAFYLGLAESKKVLEIACGSGRLTIPLAQQRVNITGLDLSSSMLKEAEEKASQSGVSINWIQGDCTNFSINEKFGLIFMTGNSLQHLKTKDLVFSYFQCVKKHLQSGGIFAFDLFRPSLSILNREADRKYFVKKYKNRAGEEVSLEESNQYDEISQINTIKWFHISNSGEILKTDTLEMRQFFPQELSLLLQHSGFQQINHYGDWDLNPPSNKNFKQIIVAQPY